MSTVVKNDDAEISSPVQSRSSQGRTNSHHTSPNVFCRQSSITSNNSVETSPINKQESTKLIKTKTDLLVLISMALIYFVGTCAFSMIAPFFAPEALKKGSDGTITGLIFAVYPLVVFIVSPLIGKLLPLIGPKFCLIAGCFLEGGSEVLFGFVSELESGIMFISFCFIIRIVTALGSACSQTAILAIVSITFKDNMSTMFGILELFSGLGFMAGPALGGFLYEVGGFKLPFIVLGSCVLLVLFFVMFILPGSHAYRNEESNETGSLKKVLLIPGVLMIGINAVIGGMVLSFLDPTLTNHLEDITNNGLSSEKIGLVFLIPSVLYTISAPLLGMVVDKMFSGRYAIILGNVICCVSYLFLGPSPLLDSFVNSKLWVVCVALGVMGIAIAPLVVPILADMQKSTTNAGLPANFATTSIISGIFNSVFSIGSVIGPTLGGALTDHMSFSWASTIFSFVLIGKAVILTLFTIWESHSKWSGKKTRGYEPFPQC